MLTETPDPPWPMESPDPSWLPEAPDLPWPLKLPASVLETICALSASCVSVSSRSQSLPGVPAPPWSHLTSPLTCQSHLTSPLTCQSHLTSPLTCQSHLTSPLTGQGGLCHESGCNSPHGLLHHTTAAHHSTSDYNSHHSVHLRHTHSHPPLYQSHSCHQSLISPDCLTTPAPHSHTHTYKQHTSMHSPQSLI